MNTIRLEDNPDTNRLVKTIRKQNVVEIENVINHDLCELNTWSTKWLMSFNPDKTEIMLFSNTDVRYNFNFTFNGNNIPITTLGI
jgi:hypothetical protein